VADDRLARERDLYRSLLELRTGTTVELEGLLDQVLRALVELTGAVRGFVELYDAFEVGGPRRLARAWRCSDEQEAEIRAVVSQGIVSAALEEGKPLNVPFALLDQRFSARESVRSQRLESVLCAPIGGAPPAGVLYLEGRPGAGTFSDDDVALTETVSRHVGRVVAQLLEAPAPKPTRDLTQGVRAAFPAPRLVGRSQALAQVLEAAARACPLDVTVLITGPSGTGKTQLARTLHEHGPRKNGPFVELNCANFVENLMESELFGIVAGAASGVTRDMPGKLEAADGGTLFLDEIGELALPAQAKLLSVIQDRRFYPVGGTVERRADVRIVAATNANLEALVGAKRFRQDLFYRLAVFPVAMPALDDRREDVPMLAAHFADEACRRHRLPPLELSRRAIAALSTIALPGNVRQLASMVERGAIIASASGGTIEPEHLLNGAARPSQGAEPAAGEAFGFHEATKRFQRQLVVDALAAADDNVSETARRLQLSRAHLHNLIRAFGLRSG
jgi:Nif-specific regulatory protein